MVYRVDNDFEPYIKRKKGKQSIIDQSDEWLAAVKGQRMDVEWIIRRRVGGGNDTKRLCGQPLSRCHLCQVSKTIRTSLDNFQYKNEGENLGEETGREKGNLWGDPKSGKRSVWLKSNPQEAEREPHGAHNSKG